MVQQEGSRNSHEAPEGYVPAGHGVFFRSEYSEFVTSEGERLSAHRQEMQHAAGYVERLKSWLVDNGITPYSEQAELEGRRD